VHGTGAADERRDDVGVVRDDVGMVRDDVGMVRDDVGVVRDDVGMVRDDVGVVSLVVGDGAECVRRRSCLHSCTQHARHLRNSQDLCARSPDFL